MTEVTFSMSTGRLKKTILTKSSLLTKLDGQPTSPPHTVSIVEDDVNLFIRTIPILSCSMDRFCSSKEKTE